MNEIEHSQIEDLRRHIDVRINFIMKAALVCITVFLSTSGGLIFYLSAEQNRTTALEGRQTAIENVTKRHDRVIGVLQQQASDTRSVLSRVEEQIRGQRASSERVEQRLKQLLEKFE